MTSFVYMTDVTIFALFWQKYCNYYGVKYD